jgi:uncharacterized OsmC-like protein
VTDPARTTDGTTDRTPYATAPDGLAVAGALLRATDERVTAVHVGRHPLTVDAPPYRHGSPAGPSPLGLLAAAVASDAAIALRAHLDSTYSYGGDIEVVVSVRPGLSLECRVTHTEGLDADQLAGAREVVAQAPLARVLGTAADLPVTFEHSAARTR